MQRSYLQNLQKDFEEAVKETNEDVEELFTKFTKNYETKQDKIEIKQDAIPKIKPVKRLNYSDLFKNDNFEDVKDYVST